ncbi:MAG: helix-hairpin-helix domain-containing protein, partial [Nitriliruptoraceae bacterium]
TSTPQRWASRALRGWAPTPAELAGLGLLLLGSLVATVLWWYPAVTGPGGARAADPGAALDAEVAPPGAPGGSQAGGPSDGGGSTDPAPSPPGPLGPPGPSGAAVTPPTGEGGAATVGGDGVGGAEATAGGDGVGGAEVTVHVTGAVVAAGLVTLPAEARVGDAVAAAGGTTRDADLERINLARGVQDGEHVHVPRHGETPPVVVGPDAAGAVGPDGLLDLNLATAAELEELPGIGPAKAAAIIAHREQHGPFAAPGDLREVTGIGEATFQRLAPLIVVR